MNKLFALFRSSKTLKNFVIYGSGQAVNLLSPLLVTPYLIYVCGIQSLGAIAIGQSMAYIVNVIVDYSSYIKGVKDVSVNRQDPDLLNNIFTTIYASKLVLTTGVAIVISLLLMIIPYLRENALLFIFSFTIVIAQALNPMWFLQGIENFKWITIINVLGKLIYVGGVYFTIKQPSDYIYANLWLGLGAAIAGLAGVIYIINNNQFKLSEFSRQHVAAYLRADFSFCVSQLFFAIRNYSSVIIVGSFGGEYAAGLFKVVEQIINFFRTYLQMFFKFTYSYVCFEIDRNIAKGISMWKKYNIPNLAFLALLLFTVYLFAAEVLYFFKVEPAIIGQTAKYLQIALLIPFLIGFTLPLEQLLFSLSMDKLYIRITMGITIFHVLAMSIIMQFMSLINVFWLLIAIELTLVVVYLYLLRSYITVSQTEPT